MLKSSSIGSCFTTVNPTFKHNSFTLEGGIPNVPRLSPPTAIEVVLYIHNKNPIQN